MTMVQSSLRTIPASFDASTVRRIDERLEDVEAEEQVIIGWAIESGSRAWGFPSPDSDYDCRFVFIRRAQDYLSPWLRRDVIETPLEGDLDVNGWELGKAIKLLLKGNAVVIEWLMSPIIYRGDPWLRDQLLHLAQTYTDRDGVFGHYLHLGERQWRTYFSDEKDVELKKLFYVLRPAAALRWMWHHPERGVAPMHFQTLLAQCALPEAISDLAKTLIDQKAVTREMGSAPLPEAIRIFIDQEFAIARDSMKQQTEKLDKRGKEAAEALFRSAIQRYG